MDDLEIFMQEVEEDKEVRAQLRLYKLKNEKKEEAVPVDEEDEDERPAIPEEELIS